MACDHCQPLEGDSTTHFDVFESVFEVLDSTPSSMTEYGTARCKTCGQPIEFDYDETLIPKLRIQFTGAK